VSEERVSDHPQHYTAGSRTKAISVLNPVHTMGSFRGCSVHIDIIEDDIGSVHHVDSPELRLNDTKIAYGDVADIPEHKWHWAAWAGCAYCSAFGLVSLIEIPDLPIAIDTASTIAIDPYVVSSQDKTSCMILELDMIGVVSPVLEIFRELEYRKHLQLNKSRLYSVIESELTNHSPFQSMFTSSTTGFRRELMWNVSLAGKTILPP
jgi:hypothetical protein